METKQLVVNGLLTHYRTAGQGKTLLLLHGWGDDGSTFEQLSGLLAGEYELYSLDLPGFGKSQTPEHAWELNDYVHFTEKFIEKINKKPYAVIGHSNGGAMAIKLACSNDYPEKLVLVAAAGIRKPFSVKKTMLKMGAKIMKFVTFALPLNMKQSLRRSLYKAIGSDYLVSPHLQETFKKIVAEDVTSVASQIDKPSLLIYGSNDTATPPRYGQIYAGLMKKSRLEIIEGASHFLHHEKTSQVATLIRNFLS